MELDLKREEFHKDTDTQFRVLASFEVNSFGRSVERTREVEWKLL